MLTDVEQMNMLVAWLDACHERQCEFQVSLDPGNAEWRIRHDQAPEGTFIVGTSFLEANVEGVRRQVDEWLVRRHSPVRAETLISAQEQET